MPDIGPLIRTDYKEVDKRDELRNVLGWVRGDTSKLPVVVDDGRPFGVVSERAMLGRRIDSKAKVEGYTLSTRALTSEATLEEAMARMAEFRAAHLPVADDRGKLAGYVSAVDVARAHANGAQMRAAELATPVTALRLDQTMSEAHHVFSKEYVDILPVIDAQGRASGVVTRRMLISMDLNAMDKGRKDAGGEKIHIAREPVSGYVEENAPVIDGSTPLQQTIAKVEQFGYVLVKAANGQLAGIITPQTLMERLRGR